MSLTLWSPSGRLKLVSPTEAEDEEMALLRSHPATLLYLPVFPAHFSSSDARTLREKSANNSCHAGIIVSPNIHGRGIATEALYAVMEFAFETRKFHKVTFETSTENIQMRGWLEKTAGACLEGVMKDGWKYFEADAYCDVANYGILEGEWRDSVKGQLEAKMQKAGS
ncbi:acyl-CoA N-acyltransferase [Mycena floridula]|nr:acyl-CoA N-acyltransferase [Mycena floridula]